MSIKLNSKIITYIRFFCFNFRDNKSSLKLFLYKENQQKKYNRTERAVSSIPYAFRIIRWTTPLVNEIRNDYTENLNKTKCGMKTFCIYVDYVANKQPYYNIQTYELNKKRLAQKFFTNFIFFRPKHKKTGKQIAESFRSPVSSILIFHFESKPSIKFWFTDKIDSCHVLRGKFSYWRLWFDFFFRWTFQRFIAHNMPSFKHYFKW